MKNISLRTSGIIIIGNEILSGRTQELNSRYLAQKLLTVGVTVNEVRIIPDVKEKIIECVNEIRKKYTFVFTSGGIGPTHDDITSECIASAFGVNLPINIEAKKLLENYYKLTEQKNRKVFMGPQPVTINYDSLDKNNFGSIIYDSFVFFPMFLIPLVNKSSAFIRLGFVDCKIAKALTKSSLIL